MKHSPDNVRLERYNWRQVESSFNATLPQFRTTVDYQANPKDPKIESLRIHFVHKRSSNQDAIPLLFCHGWPGSIVEVSKAIGPLTSPIPTHLHSLEDSPSFHVVAPSIPGFGFSDASEVEGFGMKATALLFDALMKKLGYAKYVVHGSDWYVASMPLALFPMTNRR